NGASAVDAGAVTLGDGTKGIVGVVSAANSLVGSTTNDKVGTSFAQFGNGNLLFLDSGWDNGTAVDAGAATVFSDSTGVVGSISAANSLVGSSANDRVGSNAPTVLNDGNFVLASPFWDNKTAVDSGAVTVGSSTTAVSGVISAANSLVGTTAGDLVGSG